MRQRTAVRKPASNIASKRQRSEAATNLADGNAESGCDRERDRVRQLSFTKRAASEWPDGRDGQTAKITVNAGRKSLSFGG
jgi:hypothetical protein